eukprot:2111092-Pleurochrysis_carterae.AAC.1
MSRHTFYGRCVRGSDRRWLICMLVMSVTDFRLRSGGGTGTVGRTRGRVGEAGGSACVSHVATRAQQVGISPNRFAFASAHIADKRCPLRTATHTVASSESAANANDVEWCFGLQRKTRGEYNSGGGRSGGQARREFSGSKREVEVVARVGADDQKPASGGRVRVDAEKRAAAARRLESVAADWRAVRRSRVLHVESHRSSKAVSFRSRWPHRRRRR